MHIIVHMCVRMHIHPPYRARNALGVRAEYPLGYARSCTRRRRSFSPFAEDTRIHISRMHTHAHIYAHSRANIATGAIVERASSSSGCHSSLSHTRARAGATRRRATTKDPLSRDFRLASPSLSLFLPSVTTAKYETNRKSDNDRRSRVEDVRTGMNVPTTCASTNRRGDGESCTVPSMLVYA